MSSRRAEVLSDLEHEVGLMLHRIRRVLAERAHGVHPELAPASYLMLSYIAKSGPVRASEIAEQFSIDKGAISRQFAHLTELRLLARVADPEDGRAILVSVSEEGRARLTDLEHDRRKWLRERLGDWSEDELASFVISLGRYNRALDTDRAR